MTMGLSVPFVDSYPQNGSETSILFQIPWDDCVGKMERG